MLEEYGWILHDDCADGVPAPSYCWTYSTTASEAPFSKKPMITNGIPMMRNVRITHFGVCEFVEEERWARKLDTAVSACEKLKAAGASGDSTDVGPNLTKGATRKGATRKGGQSL